MDDPRSIRDLGQLIDKYKDSAQSATTLLQGHILALYRSKSNTQFCEFLASFYGNQWSDTLKNAALTAARTLNRKIKKLSGNVHKPGSSRQIVQLLHQGHDLPVSKKRSHSDIVDQSEPSQSLLERGSKRINQELPSTCEFPDPPAPETPPPTPHRPPASSFITPKRSSTCPNCFTLRHESSSLRKELGKTKNVAKKLQSRLAVKFKYKPSILNQTINRLQAQVKKLRNKSQAERAKARQDIRELRIQLNTEKAKAKQIDPLKAQMGNLRQQIKKLKDQKANTKRYHSAKNSDSVLSKKLGTAEMEIKSLKEKLSNAENRVLELGESLSDTIQTMDGNQYDEKTRMCINYCLEKNVSLQNASGIVQFIVHEMTGKTLEKLPAPSTNANIQREFGIISDIQCGAIMSESSNVTLAWDGTTKDGVHYNEKHVVTASGPLTLGVTEMPGGKAIDYRRDLRNSLTDITNRYSQCFGTDPTDTSKKIHDGRKVYLNVKNNTSLLPKSQLE